jgi:hypothetical protein
VAVEREPSVLTRSGLKIHFDVEDGNKIKIGDENFEVACQSGIELVLAKDDEARLLAIPDWQSPVASRRTCHHRHPRKDEKFSMSPSTS